MKGYFKIYELVLWGSSSAVIAAAFFIFGSGGYLSLITSLIGAASLIFAAKGDPLGPALMIVFSVLYGVISYSFRYYGEMATYLGMTLPMSAASLVSWLRNPAEKGKVRVKVNHVTAPQIVCVLLLTCAVTALFGYILARLKTPNLIPSVISVATSFLAAAFTFLRSRIYALCYAANDVVLIVLWVLAAVQDVSYVSVTVCFCVFLVNDLYGFVSWGRMSREQQ